MNRPQRTITAPKRLIEEETPEPPKRTTRRTLNLDVPKVEVKQSVVQDVIDKPKITTRKTRSGVKKTLHLDMSDVPASEDKKMRSD